MFQGLGKGSGYRSWLREPAALLMGPAPPSPGRWQCRKLARLVGELAGRMLLANSKGLRSDGPPAQPVS